MARRIFPIAAAILHLNNFDSCVLQNLQINEVRWLGDYIAGLPFLDQKLIGKLNSCSLV